MEKAARCQMCGTADWEWEADRYAYEPAVRLCRGCEIKESVSDQTDKRPGQRVELAPASGIAAARRRLAEQRYRDIVSRDAGEDRASEGKPITVPPSPSLTDGLRR